MQSSINRDISPPPRRKTRTTIQGNNDTAAYEQHETPSLASIEAGKAVIDDHLTHCSQYLESVARPHEGELSNVPRISISDFKRLYQRNLHRHGRHFVVHQHDHPISGVHYDLRLQFSQSSTISFAIPYGLPGNPQSIRPNRMAIETRVHNLWNNLIESASHATGSLLIWDTGEYDILPYKEERKTVNTDDELTDHDDPQESLTASEQLFAAFQTKHIRIRLHGQRLPPNYTISLRLPRSNNNGGTMTREPRKRRRLARSISGSRTPTMSEDEETMEELGEDAANACEDDEDETIRANNAYPGASNTIGSLHQRHWFLSLDKKNSAVTTIEQASTNSFPFFVLGRDVERSVVTGRSADDVLQDEGVQRFSGRKMWRAIVE